MNLAFANRFLLWETRNYVHYERRTGTVGHCLREFWTLGLLGRVPTTWSPNPTYDLVSPLAILAEVMRF